MIKLIKDLPDDVLGFEATGIVTGEDYETVLIPAVEKELKKYPKLKLLFHMGSGFTSYEMKALWDDTKIGLGHLRAWERIALVSDVDWIRSAMHMFGFMIPGHIRVYKSDEISDAKKWLAE